MKFVYNSNRRPLMMKITVRTEAPEPVRVVVKDPDRANTLYMNRYKTVKGRQDFIIRMPQSPARLKVYVFNHNTNDEQGFEVVPTKDGRPAEILPLETQISSFDFTNPLIASFILFAQNFCDKCGTLSPGIYASPDGFYTIEYLDTIRSVTTKQELNTPARVNSITGLIQVSKAQFDKYTVAGRFAILCHEFAHVYSNKNMKDEIEADFHAATIYLGLGYPRIEIINVFTNVFEGADTELNRKRLNKMIQFINKFDDNVRHIRFS